MPTLQGTNYQSNVKKGPACDCSFLTEMKRRSIVTANVVAGGAKLKDSPMTRGFTNGVMGAISARGASLTFLNYR